MPTNNSAIRKQLLKAREILWQEKLELSKKSNKVIASLQLNVPGWPKTTQRIERVKDTVITSFYNFLVQKGIESTYTFFSNNVFGTVPFFLFDSPANKIKQLAIEFEENYPIGRFIDIDILNKKQEFVEREKKRQCFFCGRLAIDCMREKRHSIEDLRRYFDEKLSDFLAAQPFNSMSFHLLE
ncbi:MAG: citrate lyase holo-[acyl-carrier protein] synthase [Candidatus Heimdallarchaeota archaeon]